MNNNGDNSSTKKGLVGVFAVVFLVFLILKLTNTITWSWIWVFSPLWVGPVLGIFFLVVVTIAAVLLDRGKQ